jgi:ethanolamine ammonia-lyase large subunit
MSIWWEIYQFNKIIDVQKTANEAKYDAGIAKSIAEAFQHRIDKMAIIMHSMWSLIEENTNLTEEDLRKRVIEIDMTDGKLDGKVRKKPIKCKKCGSGISYKFKKCMICGEEYSDINEMDTIIR